MKRKKRLDPPPRVPPDPPQAEQQPARPPVRVVVVEAAAGSERLSARLESRPDVDVVAQSSSGRDALATFRRLKYRVGTVCVIDLGLPGEQAFSLIRALRDRYPTLVVLACSDGSGREDVTRALFMGADGYVEVEAGPDILGDAVVRARRGDVTLAGIPTGGVVGGEPDPAPEQIPSAPLTARELEIVKVAAEGLTARSIGERIQVSERTVTTHLAHIYRKLGARNRSEAVTAAMRLGLIQVSSTD